MQIIAMRATGRGNAGVAEMIARVRGVNGGAALQDPNQLLAQLSNNNPLVSALSRHFAEAQTNAAAARPGVSVAEPVPVIDVEPEQEAPKNPKPLSNGDDGQTVELREQVQSLQAEVKSLRDRCDVLASTVGACCLCWGQDANCRACRGRGKPGYAIPDEALFGEYVLPAMRVLRAQKVQPNRPSITAAQVQSSTEVASQISGSN